MVNRGSLRLENKVAPIQAKVGNLTVFDALNSFFDIKFQIFSHPLVLKSFKLSKLTFFNFMIFHEIS